MTLLFWYLAWQCLAWAVWPLLFTWLHRLPSRGYGLSKASGLLLTGILIWWGGILHLLPFTRSAIVLVMAALVGVGLWRLGPRRAELAAWWTQQRRFVLTVELLMAGAVSPATSLKRARKRTVAMGFCGSCQDKKVVLN